MLTIQDIYEWIKNLPLFNTILFIVLAIITVYRRKLSSNDEYRKRTLRKETDPVRQTNHYNHHHHHSPSHPSHSQSASSTASSAVSTIASIQALLNAKALMPKFILLHVEKPTHREDETTTTTSIIQSKQQDSLLTINSDLLVHIIMYLETQDILLLSQVSKQLRSDIMADYVWEQLWIQTYSSFWRLPKIKEIRIGRGIYWDPLDNYAAPQSGWFAFYLAFETCWMDWLLAGYCTSERCLVGIDHAIYDTTLFMPEHPGSPETLSEGAGCDATENFYDISHTFHAITMMKRYILWDPQELLPQASRRFPKSSPLFTHMKEIQKKLIKLATAQNRLFSLPHLPHLNIPNIELSNMMANFSHIPTSISDHLPNLPNLPNLPQLPTSISDRLPNIELSNIPTSISNHLHNLELPNLPNLPNLPQLPTALSDHLPSLPSLPTEINLPKGFIPDRNSKELFGPGSPVVPKLEGFVPCDVNQPHEGLPKAFFDPLSREWIVWWSCCGNGYCYQTNETFESNVVWVFS